MSTDKTPEHIRLDERSHVEKPFLDQFAEAYTNPNGVKKAHSVGKSSWWNPQMIKQIKRLNELGIFRNFVGDATNDVPPFKKRNLIYGWNYSGKTTLSRLFQAFQFPDRPLAYPTCRFSVELNDGSIVDEKNRSLPCPVRVFNRDFINSNFQEEHNAPAVFIVGKGNLELREYWEKLQDAQKRLEERAKERNDQIERIEQNVATRGTDRARSIGQTLGIRNFNRSHLNDRICEIRDNPESFQMTETQCQATIDTFRSGDQFSEISLGHWALPNLSPHVDAVRILLERTALFDAIEGLNENRPLEDWLRAGLKLHTSSGDCLFCKGRLPKERLAELQRHFSTASMELLNEVNQKIEQLQRIDFVSPNLNAMQFLQEMRNQAQTKIEKLSRWLEYAATIRDGLVTSLVSKRIALGTPLVWDGSADGLDVGEQALKSLNECIAQHNKRVQNIDRVKAEARTAVERHYAAVHFIEQGIANHEEKIQRLKARIRTANRARERLGRRADVIAQQIDRAAKGASRFMSLVEFLLKGSDIRIESCNENKFQLMRGTTIADKLSEGEKTAIAFAYFLTSLEGEGEDIAKTIVYVDDPISSLDTNHIYAVYALIKEYLHKALQLFVSTHNSEFFSLLKGLWLGREYKGASEAFYVRRQADEDGSFATLESLPALLRRFKSEYEFIFAQLFSFAKAPSPSEHEAFTAPNLLRRFLESYLGFRKPCTTAWYEKMNLILDSAEEREEVHKLLDDASHLQSINRALRYPSFVTSAQSCVRSVLRGIQAKDQLHYDSLIAVIGDKTTGASEP